MKPIQKRVTKGGSRLYPHPGLADASQGRDIRDRVVRHEWSHGFSTHHLRPTAVFQMTSRRLARPPSTLRGAKVSWPVSCADEDWRRREGLSSWNHFEEFLQFWRCHDFDALYVLFFLHVGSRNQGIQPVLMKKTESFLYQDLPTESNRWILDTLQLTSKRGY